VLARRLEDMAPAQHKSVQRWAIDRLSQLVEGASHRRRPASLRTPITGVPPPVTN